MWDTDLFLLLNFDGGAFFDKLMTLVSGKITWLPLYVLILWLVWRRSGWRGLLFTVVAIGAAVGLSDVIAGIFKHSGLLKGLLPDFPVRLRPMHTPDLEGLVHFVKGGGMYGTVSAHAATSISIALIATCAVRRRWFSALMWVQVVLVCYSRIYLGYHFPQDILLGAIVGSLSGVAMWLLLGRLIVRSNNDEKPNNDEKSQQ